jgi:lipid-binding SYLF domain-containing protein
MIRRQFVTRISGSGLLVATVLAAGCSTAGPVSTTDTAARDAKKQEIDAGVDGALDRLFSSTSGSRDLAQRAQGILVFPRVISAGLGIGGEYGEGSLRSRGADGGYYKMTEASVGATIGGQSKAIIIMIMTPEAYNKFVSSSGWTVGADANVALAHVGADGRLDTLTTQQPVIAFVQTNSGLMFDVSLNNSKIGKLDI